MLDPAIPLFRIYSEEISVNVLKDLTGMFGKALLMVTETRKNPNPKREWLSKLCYTR